MKSIQTLLLLATSFALAFSQQQTCNTYCAYSAPLNKSIGPSGSVDLTTYYFDGGVFPPSAYDAQAGQCGLQVAFNGNSLTITGTVYAPNDPSTGFFINIQSTRNFSGTPFEELTPSVYVSNGGYVDTTNWVYYSLNSGKLVGFGKYPVTLDLTETMHPLQVGAGANGKNINYGLSAWFDITFNGTTHMTDINVDLTCAPVPTSAPTAAPTVTPTAAPTAAPTVAPTVAPTAAPTDAPTSAPTEVPTDAPTSAPTDAPTEAPSTGVSTTGSTSGSSSDYTCPPNPFIARQAIADQYGGNSYFAFIFNVSSTNVQYRFDFTNDSGSFQENADGTATLTGSLSPLSYNPQDGVFAFDFSVQINFVAGTAPSTYHEELNPSAYVPYGPVDPSTWKYYAPSSSTFTVSGGQYTIVVSQFMDMEFQVGYGANGKNINFGASSWFDFTLTDSNGNQVASGVLDVDVDLVCEQNGSSSSTTAASSATGGQVSSPSASPSSTSDASAVSFSFLLAMILAIVFAL